MSAAQRDLETARGLLAGENEGAYIIAYHAMLLAGRAVMFSDGYRPTTTGGHAAVVEFLRIRLGPSFTEIVQTMDRIRRQRHRIVYDAWLSRRARFARPSRLRTNSSRGSRGYSPANRKEKACELEHSRLTVSW